ncbi:MAG TPA: acyl carrier protein [Gammaproteobacteria bacterium]|jgi:acyl carrier protein
MGTIEERITKIVSDHLAVKPEAVTTDAKFDEDLGADSLDQVELVMAMEEEFECECPDEDAAKINTLGSAAAYFRQHMSGADD